MVNFENGVTPINDINLNKIQTDLKQELLEMKDDIEIVVENTLESDSTTDALSAKQGKVLNEKIDNIENNRVVLYDNPSETNETVTLAQDATDFEDLEIYFCRGKNGSVGGSAKFSTNRSRINFISASVDVVNSTTTQIGNTYVSYTLSGNTLTKYTENAVTFRNGSIYGQSDSNVINITKVVGYKYTKTTD